MLTRGNRVGRVVAGGLLLLGAAVACDRGPDEPDAVVMAQIADETLSLSDFERYLDAHLIDPSDDEEDPTELNRVKSRLLDSFIEERLLLVEARRRGIEVEPWELDAYLVLDEALEGEAQADLQARRIEARDRLLVQKLRESTTLDLPPPTDAEALEYAEAHRESLEPEKRLEVRALMFDSVEDADRVHREIRRRRMTFNEAVVQHESYPGQSTAQVLEWSSLPEEVRAALDGVKKGRVSKPVETNGGVYLFRVESWLTEPEQIEAAVLELADRRLRRERREAARAALLRQARERAEIRLKLGRLPFEYVP